jgi:hypothetical protein
VAVDLTVKRRTNPASSRLLASASSRTTTTALPTSAGEINHRRRQVLQFRESPAAARQILMGALGRMPPLQLRQPSQNSPANLQFQAERCVGNVTGMVAIDIGIKKLVGTGTSYDRKQRDTVYLY